MSRIPKDITPVIREIDEELKAAGVPPVGRPMNAIIKFGQRFNMSMLFTKPLPGVPDHLIGSWKYAEKIHDWYEQVYGDGIKLDPSANAKVAVKADGDLWELKLPIIFGLFTPVVERDIEPPRVYRRVSGSIVRLLFRQRSSLRRMPPLLLVA